jgi:hypothetical protein
MITHEMEALFDFVHRPQGDCHWMVRWFSIWVRFSHNCRMDFHQNPIGSRNCSFHSSASFLFIVASSAVFHFFLPEQQEFRPPALKI